MAGLGLQGSYGAAGAADALEQLLARRYVEQLNRQRQRFAEQQQAEDTRRWNLGHQRQLAADQGLAESRLAEAAKDRAEAAARGQRQQGLQSLMADPNTPEGLRTLLRLQSLGVANVGLHDVEAPAVHGAHLQADRDTAFADWQRRQGYTEQRRRSRPVRVAGARVVQDDPTFPRGVQSYVLQLRTKHPSFESAAGELSRQLEALQAAHPRLSPQKAVSGLRQLFIGAGTGSEDGAVGPLVQDAIAGVMGGESPSSPVDATSQQEAQLRERARAAIQQRLGRVPTDDEITKVLSSEHNRRVLMGAK